MQVLPGHALADFPLSLSRRWLLLLRTDATQYVEHTHITTLSSKHTHMYQPRKQAKEACVTIAAQQRNANEPVKLPAAAKMARIYHLSSLTGPTKHRKRGSTRPVRLCCCRARHGARPRADPTWRRVPSPLHRLEDGPPPPPPPPPVARPPPCPAWCTTPCRAAAPTGAWWPGPWWPPWSWRACPSSAGPSASASRTSPPCATRPWMRRTPPGTPA